MSNYLAIATVTATLKELIDSALKNENPAINFGFKVTTNRPDENGNQQPDEGKVNLYLYQASENSALINDDIASRDQRGQIVQRPRIALDLSYLITFYDADESKLQAQRLMGSVVKTLHEHPVLTREEIEKVIVKPEYPFLQQSNLADEIERVRFTPTTMNLEELSKLWSVFFQVPYTLTVAYQGAVVLIESKVAPRPVMPVLVRNLYVRQMQDPFIESIVSKSEFENRNIVNDPITIDSKIVIRGFNFQPGVSQVRLAGLLELPQDVLQDAIHLDLKLLPDIDRIKSGVQSVQIFHAIANGNLSFGFESNVSAFVLRPIIKKKDIEFSAANISISIKNIRPALAEKQRAVLLLNPVHAVPGEPVRSYSFDSTVETAGDEIEFKVADVENGEYFVRIQIDGATSPLELDENGHFSDPKIDITEPGQPTEYNLAVSVVPQNSGTLAIDPQKPSYEENEIVTITAAANAGFVFDRWSGDFVGTEATVTITMASDMNVVAHFEAAPVDKFTLQTNVQPAGGGQIAKNPNKELFDRDELVNLTASAAPGFQFVKWAGDVGSANANDSAISVIMDQDRSITAQFSQIVRQLTVSINPAASGVIQRNPDKSEYADGESVELTAAAAEGFAFQAWSGDLSGGANPIVLIMDDDKVVTGNFSEVELKESYCKDIEFNAISESGQIVVDAVVMILDGDDARIEDATVIGRWTLPDDDIVDQTEQTNSEGLAFFSTRDDGGWYKLEILDVQKSGYKFNSEKAEPERREFF